ncbi:MAG: hypothetical protein HY591_01590 [Candidatus Omnitrophica bacterium]|nr:hypothetical protein [Candidatus Omnitrophota bacterium]
MWYNKFMYFVFALLFISIAFPVSADGPRSALDQDPSVDFSVKQSPQGPALPASAAKDGEPSDDQPASALPEAQSSYVYDLKKLIIKSRENIKRVNEKIKEQAVVKRNQKREERAREYYQRGLQLSEEGRLDEAREYFEKAVRITDHPEMMNYIKKSEFRLKAQETALKREQQQQLKQQEWQEQSRQQEAQQNYEEAVRLYREKKFREAKDQFEHVEELAADYKAARSYLRLLDQDIIKVEALQQKQQKAEMEHQQKETEAARQKEKEVWKKEIERKETERRDQVNRQAQDVYEEAVALYKEKKFAGAKKKFQDVEWVIPDYKAARGYLNRIDKDIALEQKRVEAEKIKALAQQRWEEEVTRRKQEAEEKRSAQQKETMRRKQLEEEAGFIYQAAVTLFDKKLYDDALEKFNDIEKTMPGFKSGRVYIARIKQLKEDQKRREEELAAAEARRKVLAEEKAKNDAESERQRRIEAQARERRRQLEQDTEALYSVAVDLLNQNKLEESKIKFAEADAKIPGYKKARDYLRQADIKIERNKYAGELEAKRRKIMAEVQQKIAAAKAAKPVQIENAVREANIVAQEKKAAQEKAAQEKAAREKVAQEKKAAQEKAIQEKKAQARESRAKAAQAAKAVKPVFAPAKIKIVPAPAHPPAPVKAVAPAAPVKPVSLSKEDQIKQARAIAELAQKSSLLYQKIASLADDRRIAPAKKKMAQVEQVFHDLKAKKEILLRQMREEEERNRQREIKKREEEARANAQKAYDEAIVLLRNRQFDRAKVKFLDLEHGVPGFKSTRRYLSNLDEDRKGAEREAVLERTRTEEKRFKALEEKRRAEEILRKAAEEDRRRKLEAAQEMEIQGLVDKAAILNNDILRLSKLNDFEAAKGKFDELEKVLGSLQTLKQSMGDQPQKKARDIKVEELRKKEKTFILARQKGEARDKIRRNAVVKSIPKKVKGTVRPVKDNGARTRVLEEKRRGDFIAEQVRRQRLANLLQEKERARQRELTKGLERQKILAEEQRQKDRLRMETLRFQERQRQRLEQGRQRMEAARKKQEETFQFRKVGNSRDRSLRKVPAPVPVKTGAKPLIKKIPGPVVSPVDASGQRQAQIDFSNKRKEYLDKKYKQEQARKENQEREAREEKLRQELKQKQDQAARENEEKAKAEREAQERRKKLEAERQAIRQKLVEGVKAMYQEAMRLYKAGNYTASGAKFQDIEDILPDYKHARSYIQKSRQRQSIKPPAAPPALPLAEAVAPQTAVSSADNSKKPGSQPVPEMRQPADGKKNGAREVKSASRDKAIARTLDIFDPNVP